MNVSAAKRGIKGKILTEAVANLFGSLVVTNSKKGVDWRGFDSVFSFEKMRQPW